MNLTDPVPMALWSLSLYLSLIGLVVELKKQSGLRRRVGMWISMRIHALRDRLGDIEDLVDDEMTRAS